MRVARRAVVVSLMCWFALACARKPDAPSAQGERCSSQDDCNRAADGGIRECGVLRVCVAGYCEATRDGGTRGSRVVACSADAGRP